MPEAISDSSTLIHLAGIGRLEFLDELEARRVEDVYGLQKTGVIGILIRAKLEEKVASLREELDRLRNEAGFWIGDEIYQQALQVVAEE
jgi:predicted nucleic acid-binding protein